MYEHLNAVENVALWVVGVEGFVACHLCVGVVALHHVIVDDDGERTAHNLVVDDNHYLTLGENGDE